MISDRASSYRTTYAQPWEEDHGGLFTGHRKSKELPAAFDAEGRWGVVHRVEDHIPNVTPLPWWRMLLRLGLPYRSIRLKLPHLTNTTVRQNLAEPMLAATVQARATAGIEGARLRRAPSRAMETHAHLAEKREHNRGWSKQLDMADVVLLNMLTLAAMCLVQI